MKRLSGKLVGGGIAVLTLACLYGWVANIVKMFGLLDNPPPLTGWFVARAVGIFFAPLGVVLGYL